jgi:hypothetical protein
MHRRVGAHQLVAPFPIDLSLDRSSNLRQRSILLEDMHHVLTDFSGASDNIALVTAGNEPTIGWLTTTTWVKCRLIKHNTMVFVIHRRDLSRKVLNVAICMIE